MQVPEGALSSPIEHRPFLLVPDERCEGMPQYTNYVGHNLGAPLASRGMSWLMMLHTVVMLWCGTCVRVS